MKGNLDLGRLYFNTITARYYIYLGGYKEKSTINHYWLYIKEPDSFIRYRYKYIQVLNRTGGLRVVRYNNLLDLRVNKYTVRISLHQLCSSLK